MLLKDKLLSIAEYCIYILIIFLFTGKGESLRSIGLYVPPIILIVLFIKSYPRNILSKFNNPVTFILTAISVSALISCLFSSEMLASLHFLKKTYLKVIIIFCTVSIIFTNMKKLNKLFLILALSAILHIYFLYFDYFNKAIINNNTVIFERLRPYGLSLPFYLPFVPYNLIISKRKIEKIIWICVILVGLLAVILTGFRGAWGSVFLSFSIWALWFVRSRKNTIKIVKISICILVVIVLVLKLLPNDYVKMRIHMGLSSNNRYEWRWKAYYQMYNSFPIINKIFGKGLTKKEMYSEYNVWYKQKTGQYPSRNWPRNPHNNYLSFLYKQGLIGLVLYISLLIITIRMILRKIKLSTNLEFKAIGIAILCPLISEYSIRAMVEDMRFMPLGVLLGIAVAYFNMEDKQQNDFKDYISSSGAIS